MAGIPARHSLLQKWGKSMQSGDLTSSDVTTFKSRIVVAGVERAHESWSISRDIVGDLPEQVAGGSGFRVARAEVVWADQPEVADRSANPWNAGAGWVPKAGQVVAIYVSDADREWVQYRGVVDKTTGGVNEPLASSLIDYSDWLNTPFNHSAVLRLHPPLTEGGSYMGVGMTPAYIIDRALRTAGFFSTTPIDGGALVSVPLQTSTWPERGVIQAAGSDSGGSATHGTNERVEWGWAVRNCSAVYRPQFAVSRSEPLQMSLMVSAAHSGSFTLDANYGALKVRLWINSGRAAVATLDGSEVCRVLLGDATRVVLLVKNGVWTLKTNAGRTVTGNAAMSGGEGMSTVTITGDAGSRVAGVVVSRPSEAAEFQHLNHVSSAYQETSTLLGIQDVLPSIVGKTSREVLEEISKATLSPFWFEEGGRLVMYGSDVLRRQSPVQTVTTLDDITKLSWEDSRLSMRSMVEVTYQYPAINRSRSTNVLLWQGSGETMESGQEKEFFAKQPDDEDWAGIDTGAVGNADGTAAYNQGRGTWLNSYLENADGETMASSPYVTWSPIRAIDDETRLFKVRVGALPAGYHLVLATTHNNASIPERFRGLEMPILRGKAKVQWADMRLTGAATGPSGFPALEHECGPWSVQADETFVLQRIADFIASQVTTPQPVITGLEVTYDPRRQLGDVITVRSESLMGVELRCLIVGIRNSAGDSFRQSLSVRVISAKSMYATYDQLAAAWGSGNYESLQTAWDALNYARMASNPLEVSP